MFYKLKINDCVVRVYWNNSIGETTVRASYKANGLSHLRGSRLFEFDAGLDCIDV